MKKLPSFFGMLFVCALFLFCYSVWASPGNQTGGESDWCKKAGNCGTFTDSRDKKTYKWTKIGTQIWMAENLNFGSRVDGSANQKDATASSAEKYCYEDVLSNCATYGGLYQWHSAMALPYSCNTSSSCKAHLPPRGICPAGWHVPTRAEWATLNSWVDGDNGGSSNDAGKSLKSTSGWIIGNGTDAYGWTGLPGGYRSDGGFGYQGYDGDWWSAFEGNASRAWNRYINGGRDDLLESSYRKPDYVFSIRCLKD